MGRPLRTLLLLLACALYSSAGIAQDEPTASPAPPSTSPASPSLELRYRDEVAPFVTRYCQECHGADLAEAELSLEFDTDPLAAQHVRTWQRVAEMLSGNLMPPEGSAQPAAPERATIERWIRDFLGEEARRRAGDPGRVVLRRLNNVEYTYTIRDLTAVESLDPAREFPVDSAAGEGFTNTGSALVMSPSLVSKYLDAAKGIAAHALLLPDGFRFSPHQTSRDWTEEILGEIRTLYGRYTTAEGGEQVNLQGIVFETNEGGRLPLQKYFSASLALRDLASVDDGAIEAAALREGLSPKYLRILWSSLNASEPSILLDPLRARWRSATDADVPALIAIIEAWQKQLFRFTTVGHVGKVGGPKRWLEPTVPLAESLELRHKILGAADGAPRTLRLVASTLANASDEKSAPLGVILWQRPRFVTPDGKETLVRELPAEALRLVSPASPIASGPEPPATSTARTAPTFGIAPNGEPIDEASLALPAPTILELSLPADVPPEAEFLVTCVLAGNTPGAFQASIENGARADASASTSPHAPAPGPILVAASSPARAEYEKAFDEFRALFPAALCYTKIVPVDEVVTLTQFYREDDHLQRLMLTDREREALDRLWNELHYVSRDALTQVDALEQLIQYATQDSDPTAFEPLLPGFQARAAAFRQTLVESEPRHLEALLRFAARAYRHPLEESDKRELRALYQSLRAEGLDHDPAFRMLLARVLVSPDFLYRVETPQPGAEPRPVSDWELASRLSYFLWSSLPDDELREVAASGRLHEPDVLRAQLRRMLVDPKTRRLATEFACQWLQIHDFPNFDEKSDRHFPAFADHREPLYEEATRFFADLFQNDGSVLDILEADYAYLNEDLARHYDIPGVVGPEWRRVEGVRQYARGGILAMGAILARQAGASRTSPILRGTWTSEVLLGERLPKPPPGIPPLPEEPSGAEGLTVRQIVERHTNDPKCAVCHVRIDPYGFALESFDAIGRHRTRDSLDLEIDARATTIDGVEIDGIEGLRAYLAGPRRDAFVRQFCRKLLGYSLGRAVELADEPLLDEMAVRLRENDYRISDLFEMIVQSRQFREIRGQDAPTDDFAQAATPPETDP